MSGPDIKDEELKLELIAAATVERVASAKGIVLLLEQSACLLCKVSREVSCSSYASLSRILNNYNSFY